MTLKFGRAVQQNLREGTDVVSLGLNLVGTIPNSAADTKFLFGVNGVGTYFAKAAFKPWIGASTAGRFVLKGIGQLFTTKAIYDGIVYTGALFSCAEGPDHYWTISDLF
jgi:hypothetical protein